MPTDDPSGDLAFTGRVVIPAGMLGWRFSRSSGPGGQGVNTADSRVELSVRPLEPRLTFDIHAMYLTNRPPNALATDFLKTLARVLRFQRLLALLQRDPPMRPTLAEAAILAGYADQAHMTAECTRLAGRSPAAIRAGR